MVCGESGAQPRCLDGVAVVANGEVYNHNELRQLLPRVATSGPPAPAPDCDIITELYTHFHNNHLVALPLLRGQFAFALYDPAARRLIVARDTFGIVPAFVAKTRGPEQQVVVWAASTLAGLPDACLAVAEVPPGCALIIEGSQVDDGEFSFERFAPRVPTSRATHDRPTAGLQETADTLRAALRASVASCLMADECVEFGVLLSGGVDSAIVATLMAEQLSNMATEAQHSRRDTATAAAAESSSGDGCNGPPGETDRAVGATTPTIHSFHVTLAGSDPVEAAAAASVAAALGLDHHVFSFSLEQGLAAVPQVQLRQLL